MGVAAALMLAGCGSAGSGVDTPPRLTRAGLAERLGDICQRHTDQQSLAIGRFAKHHGIAGEPSDRQLERELTAVILPIVGETIDDIGQLRPPADEEADFKAFIEGLEHGVAISKKDPSWVATGKFEPFSQARETSAGLGTYFCGQA